MFQLLLSLLSVHANVLPRCSRIMSNSLFHGIGFDIVRMSQILEQGILSSNEAKKANKFFRPNYGTGRFNGETRVSTASMGISKGAFDYYINRAISFKLNRDALYSRIVTEHIKLPFPDEVLIESMVEVENINGIVVPDNLKNTLISKLSLGLFKMEPYNIRPRIISTLNFLKENHDFENDYSLVGEIIHLVEKLPYGMHDDDFEDYKVVSELDRKMMLLLDEWAKTLLKPDTPVTLFNVVKHFADQNNKCVYLFTD